MPPKRKQKKNQKSGRQSEASSAAAAAASSSAVADSSAEDASLEFSEAHSRQHQTSTRRATMSSSTTSHRRSRSSVGSTRRGQGAIEDGVATPTPGRAPAGTAESRRQSFGSIRGRSATPHKPSRAREQKDLQHLNNRLENYVAFHKALREERDQLTEQINTTVEEYDEKIQRHTEEHESRMEEMNQQLETARKAARAEENRAEKLDAELRRLQSQTQDYETIKKERNEYREKANELEDEVGTLSNQMNSLEETVENLRGQLEEATNQASELSVELQNEKFKRESLESEQTEIKRKYHYEIRDVQGRAKTQLQKAREDWERYLNEKMEQLEVELSQQYQDEIAQLHNRIDTLTEQSKQMKEDLEERSEREVHNQEYISTMQAKLKRAEEQLLASEAEYQTLINKLREQVAAEREAKEATQDEFNELMDVKINLDAEIDHYRRILEDEESYYNLTSPETRPLLGGNTEYIPDKTGRAAAAREKIEQASQAVSQSTVTRSASERITEIEATEHFESSSSSSRKRSREESRRSSARQSKAGRLQASAIHEDEGPEDSDQVDDQVEDQAEEAAVADEGMVSPPTTRRQTRMSSAKKQRGAYPRRGRKHDPHVPQTRSRASSVDSMEDTDAGLEPADRRLREGTSCSVDLLEEKVCVENRLDEPLHMDGWSLRSEEGEQTFRFPDNYVLQPGDTVTVWSGPGAAEKEDPPLHLFWTSRYVWNNRGDVAVLLDDEGREVSMVTGTPVKSGTRRTQGQGRGPNQPQGDNCVVM